MKVTLLSLMVLLILMGCGKKTSLTTGKAPVDQDAWCATGNCNQDVQDPNNSPNPNPSQTPSTSTNPSPSPNPSSNPTPVYQDPISFTGSTGNGPGEIVLGIRFPKNVSAYRTVVFSRVLGSTPPAVNCIGVPVSGLSPNIEVQTVIDATPSSNGEVYSYRLCVQDVYGVVHSNFTLQGIRSRPAMVPSCTLAITADPTKVQTLKVDLTASASTLQKTISGAGQSVNSGSMAFTPAGPLSGDFSSVLSYEINGTASNELGGSTCQATAKVKNIQCGYWAGCTSYNGSRCSCYIEEGAKILSAKVLLNRPVLLNANAQCIENDSFTVSGNQIEVSHLNCSGIFQVTYK